MHARTRCAVALIGVALAVGACGGGKGNPDGGTGGSSIGGNVGSGGATGGGGGGGGSIGSGSACLDQPGALPRPPSGRLPCDLIPPGLRL
jgi:hypothetical protein